MPSLGPKREGRAKSKRVEGRQAPVKRADKATVVGKTRHRQGFSLLGLEARAALASGNWEAFERLTTVRLPLYSVAWGTLKSYEPGWRQWVSFCSLRDTSPFLEVGNVAQRRDAARGAQLEQRRRPAALGHVAFQCAVRRFGARTAAAAHQ